MCVVGANRIRPINYLLRIAFSLFRIRNIDIQLGNIYVVNSFFYDEWECESCELEWVNWVGANRIRPVFIGEIFLCCIRLC